MNDIIKTEDIQVGVPLDKQLLEKLSGSIDSANDDIEEVKVVGRPRGPRGDTGNQGSSYNT